MLYRACLREVAAEQFYINIFFDIQSRFFVSSNIIFIFSLKCMLKKPFSKNMIISEMCPPMVLHLLMVPVLWTLGDVWKTYKFETFSASANLVKSEGFRFNFLESVQGKYFFLCVFNTHKRTWGVVSNSTALTGHIMYDTLNWCFTESKKGE